MKYTQAEIDELIRKGATLGPLPKLPFDVTAPSKVRGVIQTRDHKLTPQVEPGIWIGKILRIELPILTKSEANQGGDWKGKSRRTKDARRQVSKLCGPHLRRLARFSEHYHAGGTLKAVFTRLGGRHLDRMANLGAALKATEDAICLMLGIDDGDPRWQAISNQETGGKVGVRIEISIVSLSGESPIA